ncbi:response regulator [Rhizobacter sp. LjRoot28]|uniref:response regulator n=1 Tax=Rhizobacter sp. LjRoot28 TaxID=3342309 RepID=UPI003ECE9FE3
MPSLERPRVVLVEDDPSVRRFVEMALEELPIELVSCGDVAQARAALQQRPAALVITDLMLPGESGLSLIESLANDQRLRAGARIAVFSAGVGAGVQARLESLAVWRILSKPVSLATLEACVQDAISPAPGRPEAVSGGSAASSAEPDVVASHFEGDRALYDAYREACLRQFEADIQEGDTAVSRADWPCLERLAHNLKTVLITLGDADAGEMARALEGDARNARAELGCSGWVGLREALTRLMGPSVPR